MATVAAKKTEQFISRCMSLASDVIGLPAHQVWIDYDEETDVLYMNFRKPQRATKTVEMNEDVLIRKDGSKIVGITIMNASIH
ncbi:MAG: DUF2283 domain-containing protein [Deltaproteobacteria bacterium]|nr:DUF2283 domain-containing protein [Deltaproteobacteria bacterium]